MTTKYFLKIEWEHFQVVVTCTALLSLPWQPSFNSQVFQNLFFSYKKIYFYFYFLDYSVTLNIILQYFIKFKTINVMIDLRTKHDFKMTNCRCCLHQQFDVITFSKQQHHEKSKVIYFENTTCGTLGRGGEIQIVNTFIYV